MSAYYNEHDPHAAAWLRNLIQQGVIPGGHVDERDIRDVTYSDIKGYVQHHFFAGLGGWPTALRMAGWRDNRPVTTGSCPCQPFSEAGARDGFADERHLWPAWHHLLAQYRPSTIFGEQVASALGRKWLSLVRHDMEGLGYGVGAADLCAAGIGAPHIRQRLFFVADSDDARLEIECEQQARRQRAPAERSGEAGGLANVHGDGRGEGRQRGAADRRDGLVRNGAPGGVGDASRGRRGKRGHALEPRYSGHADGAGHDDGLAGSNSGAGALHGFWRDADWLFCRDAKWRPVEAGTFPLAHGVSSRVGKLRAFGNAIVPQIAAEFIAAYREGLGEIVGEIPPYPLEAMLT